MKIPKKITIRDLFILNDFEVAASICIARKSKRNGLFYYISETRRDHKRFYGMSPTYPTPLIDFGVSMHVENGVMIFTRDRVSIAKYRDGTPRKWEGTTNFTIEI